MIGMKIGKGRWFFGEMSHVLQRVLHAERFHFRRLRQKHAACDFVHLEVARCCPNEGHFFRIPFVENKDRHPLFETQIAAKAGRPLA